MSKKVVITAGAVVLLLAIGLLFNGYWQGKKWKTITGCISYENTDYKYSFAGKGSWDLVDEEMGCNTSYKTAQTWGLVDHKVGDKNRDIGQLSVLVSVVKPTSPDESKFRYLALPDREIYVELGRITGTIESQTFGITDADWARVRQSFKFE